MKLNNVKIWIIHYTPLKERKEFLLKEFEKRNLVYEFIENYDREDLKEEDLQIFKKGYKKSQCAITLAHLYAYKQIIKSPYKYNLILEDDAILNKYFNNFLNYALKRLPDSYDMLFIGNAFNMHIPKHIIRKTPLQFIYRKSIYKTRWGGDGGTRCADSYFVSKKCSEKIINYINIYKNTNTKIDKAVDIWLNDIMRKLYLKVYWMEPTIVSQGTMTGKYKKSHVY